MAQPLAGPRRMFRSALSGVALATAFLMPAQAALAAGTAIVRDAETEALVQDYARPIFKAAGIRNASVQIFLIPDQSFNAFVATSQNMFINVGAVIMTDTPNELIGIIAHETGHLAANDLARLRQQIEQTKTASLIASLIGMGAVAAGALSGSQGMAQAGTGVVTGAAGIAQRSLLAYQRGQEAAADRAAIAYLNKTGQSGAGMLRTLARLADQGLLTARNADPYLQSHPLARERIIALEELVKASPSVDATDPPGLQRRHDLVRAKLVGFTWAPERVNLRYPMSDTSLPARYARAVAAYRHGALAPALKQIDGLIAADPKYAYFYELKGQALLEGGKPKESVAPLRKAVSLAPNSGLLKIMLGQALVASNNPGLLDEAIRTLTQGLQADPDASVGYRTLARAYALKNDIPMAELATAQGLFADGNVKEAKIHAERAQLKLKHGSPGWLRADDIVSYNPPKFR